jgi:drug/metabolite transporter (DMT)-like permease
VVAVILGVVGAIYCLLSAVAFGAMAVFGKLAYDEGVTVGDLLLVRFGIAALVMLVIVRWRGGFAGLTRRTAVAAFAMGAFGYAAQSASYFAALNRIDASLLALLLYFYPVLVMVGAVALGREHWSAQRAGALSLALGGMALVLTGSITGRFDWLGAALGLTSARVYTVYILTGDRLVAGTPPLPLTALVCCGAATTYAVATAVRGGPTSLDSGFAAWGWLLALSLVSTVAAILLFFAGLARVGPSVAAILSIIEALVTISLAALVFGETLSPRQLVGGALVLLAVLLVQLPGRRPTTPPLPGRVPVEQVPRVATSHVGGTSDEYTVFRECGSKPGD